MSKANVLFLCTGNSARSQMAEAFLRAYAGDHMVAHSAGITPKGLHPYTVQVMEEIGLDMSGHTSKGVRQYLGHKHFGYLIIVCADAEENCPVIFVNVGQRLFWPFDDPARAIGSEAEKLAKFRAVRDQISQKIQDWLAELRVPVAALGRPGEAG
jgi:arsenate reductase